jgi:hypothetical protein
METKRPALDNQRQVHVLRAKYEAGIICFSLCRWSHNGVGQSLANVSSFARDVLLLLQQS